MSSSPPPAPVGYDTLETLLRKLDFIRECVEIWEGTGVPRPRAIRGTMDEIAKLFCLEKP